MTPLTLKIAVWGGRFGPSRWPYMGRAAGEPWPTSAGTAGMGATGAAAAAASETFAGLRRIQLALNKDYGFN